MIGGRRTEVVVALVGLAGVVAGVYVGSLDHPFHYDDLHSIVENPHIRTWRNLPRFFVSPEMFSSDPRSAMYRPLVLASYAFNYALSEYRVQSYHGFNLMVHLANAILVFFLAWLLSRQRFQALFVGLVFGLHPINSEAVNYLSARSESLCGLFFLASFIAYVKGWRLASLVAFAGSLLSKSVGIALIGTLLGWEIFRGERRGRELVRQQWPFWLLAAGYLFLTRRLVSQALFEHPVRGMDLQLFTQAKALVYYAKLLLMPVSLSVDHQFRVGKNLFEPPVLAVLLLALTLLWLAWRFRAWLHLSGFWLGWMVVVLSPTLVVPLNVLVNEHRLYLPSVAFAILAGEAFRAAARRWGRIAWIAGGVWLVGFGVLDYQRTQVWEDAGRLWADALAKGPLMPRPHLEQGNRYKEKGRHALAIAEYEQALKVYPEGLSVLDRLVIYNNLGATYLAQGRFVDAVAAYQQALSLDSTYVKAKESLEGLLALRHSTRDPQAEQLRKEGLNLLIAGHLEEAAARLKESLARQNDPQTWMGLALVYERQEDWEAAIRAYEALCRVDREGVYAATAQNKLRALQKRR